MTNLRSGRLLATSLLILGASLWLSGCGSEVPVAEGEAPRVLATPREAGLAVPADPHVLHRTAASTTCADCHAAHGGMMGTALISLGARAVAPWRPAPSFDPVAKTCSNVACHMVPAGTFTYWFVGGDGEPVENTVNYGGVPVTTPPWSQAMSGACRACHGSPPSPYAGVWHSGFHGGTSATLNACTLCHPNTALHGNGVVDVAPRWKASCFGCH